MTDHFKDKNEQDGQSVKSFKEQILAELEEAHRLRRLREESLTSEIDQHDSNIEESVSEVDAFNENREYTTPEMVKEDNHFTTSEMPSEGDYFEEQEKIIPLSQNAVEEELKEDLEATIPLMPLNDNQLSEQQDSSDEQIVDFDELNHDLAQSDNDLSLTRVMAGFNKLFDNAGQALTEDTPEEMVELPLVSDESEEVYSDTFSLEQTQVYHPTELMSESTDTVEKVRKRQQRTKADRVARKISLILLSILTILILTTGFFVYRYVDSSIKPLDAKSTEYIQVEIPSGSGNKLIGKILEEAGVIKSGQVFNYYVKFKNYTNFQSGFYNFQKSMSLDDIASKLQEGGSAEPERPALGKILIPEGYTLEQIAKAVSLNANTSNKKDKTPFTQEEFMALVQDEAFISRMAEKFPRLLESLPAASDVKYRLEGYLFPATYSYYEETTLENIVEQMLEAMDANLSPFYQAIANNGMTVNQALTMASLVEKEGATDDDRKLIAGVFYNRWNQGMPLQSNIAILYAMGKLGQSTTLLEDATIDTAIDSPYNIYVNPGLMPGPVDSPSLSAIKATVEPEQSNYLYFVADVTTGAVYYAETYDEHSANVEKYINSHLAKSE